MYRTAFARCPRDGALVKPFDSDPLVGSTLEGRYIIEKCIGEGGMGRVYAARHKRLPKKFAIKVLFGDLAANPTTVQRFVREAELASHIEHPACISPIDFGETKTGLLFLVMQLVQGRDLLTIITEDYRLTEERTKQLGLQILQGLRHAHEKGIIHRDLKLENVMIADDNGREAAKILDFGVARRMTEDDQGARKLTKTGYIVGTPMYIAPEQAMGEQIDGRADLYSFGVILYALLSGRMPFSGEGTDVLMQSMTAPPAPLPKDVNISPEMGALVFRLLEKDPDDRPAAAQDVIKLLERVTPAGTVTAPQQDLRTEDVRLSEDPVDVSATDSAIFAAVPDVDTEPSRRGSYLLGGATFLVALLVVATSQFMRTPERSVLKETAQELTHAIEVAPLELPLDAPPKVTVEESDDAMKAESPEAEPKPKKAKTTARRRPAHKRRAKPPGAKPKKKAVAPANESPRVEEVEPSDTAEIAKKAAAKPPPSTPTPATRDDFLALHARVGALLEKVADDKSKAPISAQYFAISVPRALGDAATRQKAMTLLNSIQQRVR